MQSKNWGAFLCDCRSTLNVNQEKIGGSLPLLKVATNPEEEVHIFAKEAEKQDIEHVLVACCAEPALFEKELPGKSLHFLDLKGKCFAPHSDTDQSHLKALKLIQAEIRASSIKTHNKIPINPLRVGSKIVIYSEFAEAMKMGAKLEELVAEGQGGLTYCFSPETEGLRNSPLTDQRVSLVGVDGRLGNLRITLEPEPLSNGQSQKRYEIKADQLLVLTKIPPEGINQRTGVHLVSSIDEEILEETAVKIRDLVGYFHKPEHVIYNQDICAGGDKGIETCGRCIKFCPYESISRQTDNPFRIKVDHLSCEGCGACVSACPTSSLQYTEPTPQEIYTRISDMLSFSKDKNDAYDPPVILFHCEEMGSSVLRTAGKVPYSYSPAVLPIEVPCLRYVSESNMLAALSLGAGGVGLLGCENCPNGERELLYQKYEFTQLILKHFDLGQERVQLMTAQEGMEEEAINSLNKFVSKLSESSLIAQWTIPSKTGNREILTDVIRDLIEQTSYEPGSVEIKQELPFAYVEVNESGCTLCRSCANVCPSNAFKFEEENNSLHFKHINCVGCGLCENLCPEKVISLKKELHLEKISLDYRKVAEDEMVACTQCKKPYINRRALEKIEEKILEVESLQSTFSGDRKNILRMCPDCRTLIAMQEVDKGWRP